MCGVVGYISSSKLINHELINDLLNSINQEGQIVGEFIKMKIYR